MMRSVNEENVEENRKVQVVKSAFNTLSFSELEAIIHIFDELNGDEGILVASKIADRVGITRSVIVNALRKFESAGVIESRSSGMKGTYIKVLNDYIFDELDGDEGILVASKIADRVGITRSVIVNALRKFESAGVIESRSSGMKGTYIKVLNDVVFDELKAIKASNSNLK